MRKLIVVAILCLAFMGVASAQGAEQAKLPSRVMVGAGIPYGGGYGAGLEATLSRHFAATLGAGVVDSQFGWAGGLRAYPLGHDLELSPRISAYYGSVATLEWPDGSKDTDAGLAYGIGLDWRSSPKVSLEFELLYIDYDPPGGFISKDGSDLTYMIGYGFYF